MQCLFRPGYSHMLESQQNQVQPSPILTKTSVPALKHQQNTDMEISTANSSLTTAQFLRFVADQIRFAAFGGH